MNVLTLSKLVGEANGTVENIEFTFTIQEEGMFLFAKASSTYHQATVKIEGWYHGPFTRKDDIFNESQWLEEVSGYLTECIKHEAIQTAHLIELLYKLKQDGADPQELVDTFNVPVELMGGIA